LSEIGIRSGANFAGADPELMAQAGTIKNVSNGAQICGYQYGVSGEKGK